MEILQKYWYVAIFAFVGLFLLARRDSGGGTVQQVGGNSGETLALAQLSSAEREADESRKFGLVNSLLNYDLSKRALVSQDSLARIGLSQQLDLARISSESQAQLALLQANSQQFQWTQQAQLQNQALQYAYNTQRRNDWLGAISTGIQTIVPQLFGNSTSGGFGGFNFPNTPPIFGN